MTELIAGHSAFETKLAIERVVNKYTFPKNTIFGKLFMLLLEIKNNFLIPTHLEGVCCDEGSNFVSLFGRATDWVPAIFEELGEDPEHVALCQ